MFEFEVYGEIVGKARPRMNTYTGRAYTPTKTKCYEYYIKQCFLDKYMNINPIEKDIPIKIRIVAEFDVPKSTSQKKRVEMLNENLKPTKKPDIDNIVKIILDALNKLAYYDDTQIVKLEIEKKYADIPKVYIRIDEI